MTPIVKYSSLFVLVVSFISFLVNQFNYFSQVPYSEIEGKIDKENILSLMTYNIRFEFLDFNKQSWIYRKEKLLNNIRLKHPDILSFQEDTLDQLNYLYRHLHKDYNFVGMIKDAPKHSHNNCIFYKKEKFEPIYNHTIWLNEKQAKNELGWDSKFPRSATIAMFRSLRNPSKTFFVANAHLDHKGKVARIEGIKMVLNYLKELNSTMFNGKDIPIFLMGDFNESPRQKVDKIVLNNEYVDIWKQCRINSECKFGEFYTSSFHYYFGKFVNNFFARVALHILFLAHGGKFSEINRFHIDHMYYLSKGQYDIQPLYVSMPSDDLFYDKSGIYASDHFPLFAVVKFSG